MKNIVVLLGLFLFCGNNISAQNTAATESKEIYFKIIALKKINKDTIHALLDGGTKQGITKGLTGPVKAAYVRGESRFGVELGFASVRVVNDSETYVVLRPLEKNDGNSSLEIQKGDFVLFNVNIKEQKYRSIFFELGSLNIFFVDIYKKPLYSFENLMYSDSKENEDAILSAAAKNVNDIYEYLKDSKDTSYDVFRTPIKKGRYAGRTYFEVMRDCKPRDIYTYINYVKTYSSYFMGQTINLPSKFVDWVESGAYFSKSEVKDSVLAYAKNPILLKKFLEKNRQTIIDEGFVNDWIIDAISEPDSVYEKSMLAAKLALQYIPSDNNWGAYYYAQVQKLMEKEEYKKSIPLCDSSLVYFVKAKNNNAIVILMNEKSRCFFNLMQYNDCLSHLEKTFAFINNPTTNFDEKTKNLKLLYYYRLKSLSYYYLSDFKSAIPNFITGINLYKAAGSFENIKSAIYLQNYLTKIYTKQGETNKALEIYNEQLELYIKLNDKANIASTLNDIALAEFKIAQYRNAIRDFTSAENIYIESDDFYNAGFCKSNIGQAYWNLGSYDSAITSHQQALSYRRTAKSFSGLGYSWEKIGELYKLTGDKNKAFSAYDSSAYYYGLAKDTTSLRSLLASYGDVYYNDKQYQKAFDYYKQWNYYNKAAKDKSATANSLYWLAATSYYFNDDTSRKFSNECLTIAKEIGDKTNEYYATTNLGSLAYKVFDYDLGNKHYTAALKVANDLKNKNLEASLYRTIGSSYTNRMDFDNALPYLNKSLHIYDSLGDKSQLPLCYRIFGNLYQSKGDFYEARNYYDKAITVAKNINNKAEVGYSYSAATFLYVIQGELSKAQTTADSTYAIFKELNNGYQIAEAYFNMALVYEAKSDGVNAIKYYKMADSIYLVEKDIYSRSTCHTNMGAVLFYQADYKNSLAYFEEAAKLLSNIKLVTEAHILAPINIGENYFYLNDYVKAEKYLKEGYEMGKAKNAGRMINISSSFLGKLYYETKKYDLSEKYLLESFAIAEKSNETDLYINTGITLAKLYVAQKNTQKGEYYFAKTSAFIKKIDNSKYTWWALYENGLYFYNQAKYDSAISYFKQAVAIVENESQNLFGGSEAKKLYNADARKVDLYNKLVASLAKVGNKEDALYYADKGNVQAVKEIVEKAGIVTNDKEKADALKKGNDLLQKKNSVVQAIVKEKSKPEKEQNKQLIASLESVKDVAETDYTNYIESLQKKYPDLQAYFSNTNPKDFKNYIDDIPDSTLVVLYIINDNQLLIFTVTNKETGIKTIDLKQDINKQAARYLAVLRNPNNATGTRGVTLRSTLKPIDDVRGDFKAEASALYDLLITPIADQMKDKKNLCIIPNGKLSSIPFQCLGTVDDKQNFHFLVEDYAIFYTSKIDIFRKNHKDRKMENSTAIFGNPDKSLPGATVEAKEISKLIDGSAVFVEEQATEDKAKQSLANNSYVHFATHGVLDYEKAENSYLLFAPSSGDNNDGKLTIAEINGLSKPTSSLVVLSACETAVSKEEVKGFYTSPANAFLINRVDVVIGSLWKVPDETTNLMLLEFYKNLKNGKTKVQALRIAQAFISQNPKYQHPFYWSAFVLYGDWR